MKTLTTVPPKLALGKTLSYLHRQWPRLILYPDDGRYLIDNNRAENAIRPFVIDRKSWLFSTPVVSTRIAACYQNPTQRDLGDDLFCWGHTQAELDFTGNCWNTPPIGIVMRIVRRKV